MLYFENLYFRIRYDISYLERYNAINKSILLL